MKKFFSISLKVFLSLLFTFALIEIGLRLFPSVIPIELLYRFHEVPRAEIAHRLNLPTKDDTILIERDDGGPPLRVFKPATKISYTFNDPGVVNTMVMDEAGFCNPPENPYNLPTIDIITIGDSFTWCPTIESKDTWTSELSQLTNLSTYNLGLSGIGLYEYLQILEKFGLQKSPKIVVKNIYEGNDLRDALKFQTRRDWTSVPSSPNSMYYKLFNSPLERYSYAVNLMLASISGLQALGYLDPPPPPSNFRYNLSFAEQNIPFNPQNVDADEIDYARMLFKSRSEV